VSLVDITAASVLLQPGIVYYAKIQLTGAESAFGTASDVAEKFSSLGYTPPPDFVGPPEPGWNWPVAPSNSTPTPAPTPSAPEAPGVTVASATPKPNLLVGLAAVAVIALVLFEVTRRRG
jgi:hypothetical protein